MHDPANELPRITLPRTPVNKAIYSKLELRFCLNESLDSLVASPHQPAHAILHGFIDGHVSTSRYSRATLTNLLEGGPSVSLHTALSDDHPNSPVWLILYNFHCAFHRSA